MPLAATRASRGGSTPTWATARMYTGRGGRVGPQGLAVTTRAALAPPNAQASFSAARTVAGDAHVEQARGRVGVRRALPRRRRQDAASHGVAACQQLERARRAQRVTDLRLEGVNDGDAALPVEGPRDGARLGRVVERCGRRVGADQVHLGSSRPRRARPARRRARPVPSRSGAVRCRASDDAPKPATKSRVARGSRRASASTAAPSPRLIPSRPRRNGRGGGSRGGGAEDLEAGGDEHRDVVEAAGEAEVAGVAPEAARRQADRQHRRRARPEDQDGGIERPAQRPRGAGHRSEVGRAFAVGHGLASCQRGERALRDPHPAAARCPCSTRPTRSRDHPGRTRVEVRRARGQGAPEQRGGAVRAVAERGAGGEGTHQAGSRELFVPRDGHACPGAEGPCARGGGAFAERRHGPERDDGHVAHGGLSVSGSASASASGGSADTASRTRSMLSPIPGCA